VSDGVLWLVPSGYREVIDIQAELWSRLYRYPVANGIRLAIITLAKHIPSHITVAGHRVLMAYDGQPMACYGFNARFTVINRARYDGDYRIRRPYPPLRLGQIKQRGGQKATCRPVRMKRV
jgi:hypothetical protein